jgi:DNA-binding CsgD family transcriptional regulator
LFDRVHYGFIARLRSKFDVITETDIRLLALIKLGLNNREMSNALGVTQEAIKKSRQRLRKKIELPEEESLERIVAGI